MSVRIGVLGSQGRMGQQILGQIRSEKFSLRAQVACEVDRDGKLESLLACDAIIDFSLPAAGVALSQAAALGAQPPVLVVGSTGWKLDERRELEKYAAKAPVIMASNFSTGVMALLEFLKRYSRLLEKLGYVPSIVETHHEHKKDAPSGTALSLQRVISPEGPGNVETKSIRTGEVIGDHEVTFQGQGDKLVFGHFAQDRSIFAAGAVEAALWLHAERKAGRLSKGITSMEPYFQNLMKEAGL